MVLALLHESDLLLTDDVIEVIVDKVQISLTFSSSFACSFKISKYIF